MAGVIGVFSYGQQVPEGTAIQHGYNSSSYALTYFAGFERKRSRSLLLMEGKISTHVVDAWADR